MESARLSALHSPAALLLAACALLLESPPRRCEALGPGDAHRELKLRARELKALAAAQSEICKRCLAGEIGCGEGTSGTLDPGDCDLGDGSFVDAYRLELAAPKEVTIELASTSFDTTLIVEDSLCEGPEAVAFNDDCTQGDVNRSCVTVTLEPGTYFILANSFAKGETGGYLLEVTCDEPPPTTCERCQAGEVRCGDSVEGTLEATDCDLGGGFFADAYRFQLPTRQEVTIALSSTDFDTYLALEDAACERPGSLASSGDCSPGAAGRSCLTVTLEPGTYFVLATSFSEEETGAYRLEVTCSDPPPSRCEECLARAIRCGGSTSGTLEPNDCDLGDGSFVDAYRFDLGVPQQVTVRLRSAEFDTYLLVEDARCELDAAVAENDDCTPGDVGLSCLTLDLPAGSYFILASSFEVAETGGYTLEVEAADCGGVTFLRGDCDADGRLLGAVTDAVVNFRHCFTGADIRCRAACDTDGDGNPCTGVTDGLRILLYLFRSGPPMPPPFPDCGTSTRPEDEALGCEESGCQ